MDLIIVDRQKKHKLHAQEGQNLLDFLQRHGFAVQAPCGGKGTCGKCKVEIAGVGIVLACRTLLTAELLEQASRGADGPLIVTLSEPQQAQISTDGLMPEYTLDPQIVKSVVQLPLPSLTDQRSDEERFTDATGAAVPYRLLPELPRVLAASQYRPAFYFQAAQPGRPGEVLRFVSEDSPEPLGVAVDIGTTTLAAWLYDLGSGRRLATAALLNPQQAYGADVISRIEFASASAENGQAIRQSILDALADLAATLIARANDTAAANHAADHVAAANETAECARRLQVNDICHYVLAGNTTMLHLLTGLPAAAIARAPFIPTSLRARGLTAGELGLNVASDAWCQLLPGVSAYIGADITAGVLACRLKDPELLLDIGTNGEIVLAGPQGYIACATAAGPAFEGANILCGMGGISGAIAEFAWQDGKLVYNVINGASPIRPNGKAAAPANGSRTPSVRPAGICGSGLVAALAVLLDLGVIEPTGRITDEPEELPSDLAGRIIDYHGQPAVVLVEAAESATGEPIILTQKDIREIQNAKAAIAAGIALLISLAGLTPQAVKQVYLAGGFGSYLDVLHAFRIGMLPNELAGRTRAVGNTSGMGAILCLLEGRSLRQAESIAQAVRYYELSGDKRFVDLYVDAMFFPEPES
jgi:uncharacterized 2Fe-2S/4Fe-4S cluster protein (DUF4445 family)